MLLLLPGCGIQIGKAGRGSLTLDSRQRGSIDIGKAFETGYFSVDDKNAVTVVLLEGEPDAPTAALIIRMFWLPKVASTPIDRTATNASVHYAVFGTSVANRAINTDNTDVGLYTGAGYLYPNNGIEKRRLKAGLWEANIQLADRSEGFIDQVGPSVLAGAVRAKRDDERVAQLIRMLGRQTSDRLGYPRLVMAE